MGKKLSKCISDRALISGVYTELLKFNEKKKKNPGKILEHIIHKRGYQNGQ